MASITTEDESSENALMGKAWRMGPKLEFLTASKMGRESSATLVCDMIRM